MEPISDVSNQYNMNYESKKLTGGLNDIEAGKLKSKMKVKMGMGMNWKLKRRKEKDLKNQTH